MDLKQWKNLTNANHAGHGDDAGFATSSITDRSPDKTIVGGNASTFEEVFSSFAEYNISKHANAEYSGARDGGCRICHEDGHFARDCPNKTDEQGGLTGECYNCGEVGHNKADCTNPRVERPFTGTCRYCEKEGHRAAECPEKPPATCKVCGQEGHLAAECNANRLFAANNVKELSAAAAWEAIVKADGERDIDEVKENILAYARALPDLTLVELENALRNSKLDTHLIAKTQDIPDTYTITNFQGEIDQKYIVSFQWTEKPRRAKFADNWPKTPEENLDRLKEAGFPLDRMVPKCSNCNELGHGSRQCPQEKVEKPRHVISCVNCDGEGHYARDCTQPLKSGKRGCKNCGGEGHIAKECPEPPNPANVECKSCGEMGHFSRDCPSKEPEVCRNCGEEGHRARECEKERVVICRNCDGQGHVSRDCPEPRNMSKVQCRNCDEYGHTSRDCQKPTDWSRVKCSNCEEMGHTYKRCPKPAGAASGGDDGGWGGDGGAAGAGVSSTSGGDAWGTGAPIGATATNAPPTSIDW